MTKEVSYALGFLRGGGGDSGESFLHYLRQSGLFFVGRTGRASLILCNRLQVPSHLDTLDVCSASPPRRIRLRRWDFPSRSPPSSASLPLLLLLLLLSTCSVLTSLSFKNNVKTGIPPRRHSPCPANSFPLADFSVVGTDLTCSLSSFSPLLLHRTRPATKRKIFSKPAFYWFHLGHGICRSD